LTKWIVRQAREAVSLIKQGGRLIQSTGSDDLQEASRSMEKRS
jgi:hypothetical protein